MKRILSVLLMFFLAVSVYSAVYYVDSESGEDSNDGLTQQTPWKTISKVNSIVLNPGDSVLFKCGQVWRENLIPQGSGTQNNPITFSSYGTGPKPKILGSISKTGINNWINDTGNIWYSTGVYWDKNYFNLRQGMVFHDGIGGKQEWSKASLNADWEWWYDEVSSNVYVYHSQNPGTSEIEIQQRIGIGWSSANYIEIKNFEIAYCEIGIAIWQGQNWKIEDCYIHDIVVDGVHVNASSIPARAGIVKNCYFTDWDWKGYMYMTHNYQNWAENEPYMGYAVHVFGSDQWTVTGCTFTVINMQCGTDTTPIAFDINSHASLIEGNVIDGANKITGPSTGIMLWQVKGTMPVIIRNNKISNIGGMGIIIQDFSTNNFEQQVIVSGNILTNMCSGDGPDHEALRIWTQNIAPVTLTKNIINRTFDGTNTHHGIRIRQSITYIYNNTVYSADNGISVESNSVVTLKNNISSSNRSYSCYVQTGSTVTESHNDWYGTVSGFSPLSTDKNANPLFINALSGNFGLSPGSPCIDAGTDVGLLYYGNAPDMGAVETYPGLPEKIQLTANPSTVYNSGMTFSTITAKILDGNNYLVEDSTASIWFSLTGSGTLEGTNPVTASSGIASIIYRAGNSTGTVSITATSSGLQSGTTTLMILLQIPSKISVNAEPSVLYNDSVSTSIITARIEDNFGYTVLNATNVINFSLKSGPGVLIGSSTVTPSEGIGTIIFRAGNITGTSVITATSYGLLEGSVNILIQSSVTAVLDLLSPDGGEIWASGTRETVTWTWSGPVGRLNIDLTTNSGLEWMTLVLDTENDGIETVLVPDTPGQFCKIRIQEPDGSPYDVSSNFFRIYDPFAPVLTTSVDRLVFGEVDIYKSKTLTFEIINTSSGTLSGTITSDRDWILIKPSSFTANRLTVFVTADNEILAQPQGEQSGRIFINSNGGNKELLVYMTATCVLVRPNPYIPQKGSLEFYGSAVLTEKTIIKIYSVSGRHIKTLKNELKWDGKDEEGRSVTDGIYIYTYDTPLEKGTGKFTLIK